MTILLPFVAVLIPSLTLPFWLFYFDITPKVAVLLVAAAVATALIPRNVSSIRALLATRDGRNLTILLALQGLAVGLSTLFSSNPTLSTGGSNWRMYGLLTQLGLLIFIWLAAAAIRGGQCQVRTTLRATAVCGSMIAIYAVSQYLGWDPLLKSATYHIGEGEWTIVRPPGTIGHADYLGSYLVFVVFLGGSLAWTEGRLGWRLMGAFTILSGAFAIVLSGTRSAMLGLAVGIVLALIWMRPNWKATAAVGVLCAIALTGFYFSPLGLKMHGRARWFREDPAGGARILLWRDSLRMIASRPLTGWGAETFSTEFPRFQSLELARAFPDFYHESPHNIFLDEFVAQGILGALAFCVWCLFAGRKAWSAMRGRRENALIGVAFFAGLVSLQFNAFVLTTAFFFYLAALLLMVPEGAVAPLPAPVDRRTRWLWIAGTSPVAVVLAAVAFHLVTADVLLARDRSQLERGDIVAAADTHHLVRHWDLRRGSSDFYYSRNMGAHVRGQSHILMSVKAWQEAVQAGIRATRMAEDRHNAFYHLASLYAQVNNAVDAEKSLRGAIAAAPNWFKPHWLLAQLLQAGGRNQEALTEAETAVSLDGGKHAEVSETLRQLRSR